MSRRPDPSYRQHRQSGLAVVTLSDADDGRRRDFMLGEYASPASYEEYERVMAKWKANGRRLPTDPVVDITIAELIVRYWQHVESYYRHPDGTPTGEVQCFTYALRPLNYLHGQTPTKDFGPLALKVVREAMVAGYEHPEYGPQPPICRTQINARVKRIRRMFKWAVENELVSPTVLQGLQAVAALKRGRSQAREAPPVLPVSRAVMENTLPLLRPMQADMVRLQLESGMRPGELVVMRACDIDMTGAVWLYRPGHHKTEHHGHQRVISLGPKCQAIIRRHLSTEMQAYLFSPKKNMAERSATLRSNRKTKVQPSQQNRRAKRPKKAPGDRYTVVAYGRGIAQAIKRHNAKVSQREQIPHWHPHQLRHTRALELKREAGLDVARAVLGHRSPAVTEHYATLDIAKAAEVMAKLG